MKKKKGSTLLIVTIFTGLVISVAAVSMAVVANDYKMKVTESKKVANLYGAESGLNMAYNVLVKVFDYAVEVANDTVVTSFDKNLELEESQDKINEVFQTSFLEVFDHADYTYGEKSGTLLQLALDNQVYPTFTNDGITYKPFDFSEGENLDIEVEMQHDDKKMTFTFVSDFESNDSQMQSNNRKVSVKYSIYIPTYQGAIKQNRTEVMIKNYPVFADSVMNIDQNAFLTGVVNIDGNMRVKGNDISTTDRVYMKYANGISLSQGALTVVNGNVITNETLSLNMNANATINGNVYARNVYLGKLEAVEVADTNAHLSVSDSVLLDNDLAINVQDNLNGTLSTVKLNNLYGLNDKNIYDSTGDQVRESSSLIINSEGAKVEVVNETYLSGVAYIDTDGKPYQTGESVAIKGNYLVYTEILPGYEDRVQLRYYNPLLLIESIDGDNSLGAKANYFVTVNSSDGTLELSDGGVSLNRDKTYTVGASISTGNQVQGSTITIEKQKEMINHKKSYASQVFNMGMSATETDYINGVVKKSVINQIDFSAEAFTKDDTTFNHRYGNVVLNSDEDVVIIVEGTENGNQINYVNKSGDVIKSMKDIDEAFIVTKGDVILSGDVSLTGNIISAGNLRVSNNDQNTGSINLKFDKQVTQHIIAANYKELKSIFKEDLIQYDTTKVEIVDGVMLDELETKYFAEDYIRMGRWQLLK